MQRCDYDCSHQELGLQKDSLMRMTYLELQGSLTTVTVREIDEWIHSYLSVEKQWSWDKRHLVDIAYGSTLRSLPEPEVSHRIAGMLVQDLVKVRFSVDGSEQTDFFRQITNDTRVVIEPIDVFDYRYCMVEVSETPVIYQLSYDGRYDPEQLSVEISRIALASGVQCDFMYPFYSEEMLYPLKVEESEVLRSYVVCDSGLRTGLTRFSTTSQRVSR